MISVYGATLGKMMIGAVVLDKEGRRCSGGRAFARAILEYTYLLPLAVILSIISLIINPNLRSALDYTAGTMVYKRKRISGV